MAAPKKVIVIDDHSLFRYGLVSILSRDTNLQVVAELSGSQDIESLDMQTIDMIITDISLGEGESGLKLIDYFKKQKKEIKVVVLSMHKEEFYILNAIEAGADGYFYKDVDPDELLRSLGKIFNGERMYSQDISQILLKNLYKPSRNSNQPFLTRKEKEIINYLMDGMSSKEISTKLKISARTVETHRHNILTKFGLKNTSELIKKVMEQKIKF